MITLSGFMSQEPPVEEERGQASWLTEDLQRKKRTMELKRRAESQTLTKA